MISDKHLCDAVHGDFAKPGETEFHIRLWGETKQHNGRIMWVDFKIFAPVGYDKRTGERLFNHASGQGMATAYDDAEVAVEGFVKWDGCTQFTADVHVDGNGELRQIFAAIERARELAATVGMPNEEIAKEYRR